MDRKEQEQYPGLNWNHVEVNQQQMRLYNKMLRLEQIGRLANNPPSRPSDAAETNIQGNRPQQVQVKGILERLKGSGETQREKGKRGQQQTGRGKQQKGRDKQFWAEFNHVFRL